MGRINLGWSGALIIAAIIMISMQCFGNQETYEQALLKCTQFKTMSERNVCRMHVTERYKSLPDTEMDEPPCSWRVNKVTLEDYRLDDNTDER